jgi:hypothetical protein
LEGFDSQPLGFIVACLPAAGCFLRSKGCKSRGRFSELADGKTVSFRYLILIKIMAFTLVTAEMRVRPGTSQVLRPPSINFCLGLVTLPTGFAPIYPCLFP